MIFLSMLCCYRITDSIESFLAASSIPCIMRTYDSSASGRAIWYIVLHVRASATLIHAAGPQSRGQNPHVFLPALCLETNHGTNQYGFRLLQLLALHIDRAERYQYAGFADLIDRRTELRTSGLEVMLNLVADMASHR